MIIPWRYCRISLIGLLTHIEEDKAGLRRLGSLGRLTTTRCVMASLPQRPPRRLTLPGEDPDLNVYLSPPPPGHQWCVQDTQWGVGVCGPDVATKKTVTFFHRPVCHNSLWVSQANVGRTLELHWHCLKCYIPKLGYGLLFPPLGLQLLCTFVVILVKYSAPTSSNFFLCKIWVMTNSKNAANITW